MQQLTAGRTVQEINCAFDSVGRSNCPSLCKDRHGAKTHTVYEKLGEPFLLQGGRLAAQGPPPLLVLILFSL